MSIHVPILTDLPANLLSIDTSGVASAAIITLSAASSTGDTGIGPDADREAATEHGTLAYVRASRISEDTRSHSEVSARQVQELLEETGLDPAHQANALAGIVVGIGPGPFTGLRVGIAQARIFSYVWKLPLYAVMSLDALAWQASHPEPKQSDFLVVTDARRKEVYWARYNQHGHLVDGPHVSKSSDIPAAVRTLPALGIGAELYAEDFNVLGGYAYPDAASLGLLAAHALSAAAGERSSAGEKLGAALAVPFREPSPLYLRESDAKLPGA